MLADASLECSKKNAGHNQASRHKQEVTVALGCSGRLLGSLCLHWIQICIVPEVPGTCLLWDGVPWHFRMPELEGRSLFVVQHTLGMQAMAQSRTHLDRPASCSLLEAHQQPRSVFVLPQLGVSFGYSYSNNAA